MNLRFDLAGLANQKAQEEAHARVSWPVNLTPATVSYTSQGHLLIIGNERDCRLAAVALEHKGLASLTLLVNERLNGMDDYDEAMYDATRQLTCHYASSPRIGGYLGQFIVTVADEQGEIDLAKASLLRPHFDLILDLAAMPTLTHELPPPGYFTTAWGSDACQGIIDTLVEHVGEFEKPRYFTIDNALCAHAGRGKSGCTRCLEVCPADAIVSRQKRIEAWIEIDPFLCHGAGSCTTACPTGAIQYRVPDAQRQQDFVWRLVGAYLEAGGQQPVVRFVEQGYRARETSEPAPHVLDIPLEELGAAGLDQWLAAFAAGACEVRVQTHEELPPSLTRLVEDQLAQAHALLDALGHAPQRLQYLAEHDLNARDSLPSLSALGRRESAPTGAKRDALNETLSWLAAHGTPANTRSVLSHGAPFGAVAVDTDACTLCMSCVSVCPTPALAGGKDQPQLSFREADCVQCGLCAEACPETAISLVPGFLAGPERLERSICKEEAAFECIHCGKPFATVSTIESIKKKLAAHPYFAGDALSRLEMCEDCRVKDVWHEMARNPEAQLKV